MIGRIGAATAAVLLATSPAFASSGWVTGNLLFYQNQGGYCPANRNCTGARYLESEFHTNQALANTKIYVRRSADGAILGQGTTNAAGVFLVRWFLSGSSRSVPARIEWRAEHKDGRFAIRNGTGLVLRLPSSSFTLISGTTSGAPQRLGDIVYGSPDNPHKIANVYDGALMAWSVLSQSARMRTHFWGIEVRAFSDDCPTSCAIDGHLIKLDPDSAFAPQARILHEMGHVASFKASEGQVRRVGGSYCYGGETKPCKWDLDSPEYASRQFEEGLATFLGDAALYSNTAANPHTCYASAAACNSAFNLEANSSCGTRGNRQAINVVRYLWDIYDSNADYPGEHNQRPLYEFLDNTNRLSGGTENRGKDEMWACFINCWIDDQDGRSAVDFREVWKRAGVSTATQWSNNCSPIGD